MLITKDRQEVISKMNEYADNTSVLSVGMLGFQLEGAEIESFQPEDYLSKAITYYKQFFDVITIHYNIQINPLPQDRTDVSNMVVADIDLTNQDLITHLNTNLSGLVDIVYFDRPTISELESWHDHLLNSTAILAADYKGPSMPKMPYWARYINTYYPVYNKLFGIVPKPDLTSASTGRITMNHLWRHGVTMCLPGNEVPDYGRMIISPHYRNTTGETGSTVLLSEETKGYRNQIIQRLDTITDWSIFDPVSFIQYLDDNTPEDTFHEFQFADFHRMIRTTDYIPNFGSFEVILHTTSPNGKIRWVKEIKMINCDETKFFNLNIENDFNGTPSDLNDLRDNFSVSIIDSNYTLPTELTTEPIDPLQIF